MKYRVLKLNDDKFCIMDVLQTSEKLFKRNNIFYGIHVEDVITRKELFKKFRYPTKNSQVLGMDREGDVVYIQYVEVVEGKTIFHRDSLELIDLDERTLNKIDKFILKFKKNRPKKLAFIAKSILAKSNMDDPFVRSARYIEDASKHPYDIKSVSEEEAKVLYEYMIKLSRFQGIDLIKYVPMKRINKDGSSLKAAILEFILSISIIPLIGYLSYINMYGFSSTFLVAFMSYIGFSVWQDDNYALSCKEAFFDRLLVSMAEEYKIDLQQIIDKEYSHSATPSFVDFIIRDLKYNEIKIKSPKIQALLENLAQDYSNSKRHEELFGSKPVDKEKYMSTLLDIEMAMYSSCKRYGLMSKRDLTVNKGHIFERLRFLGWGTEEIYGNFFVREMMKAVDRISEHPYEGCEVELQSLVKLATKLGFKSSKIDTDYEELYETISEIEDAADYKLAQARALEEEVLEAEKQEEKVCQKEVLSTGRSMEFKPLP